MDGEIKVESQLNKGSVFTFHIPLQRAFHGHSAETIKKEREHIDLKGKKILIVDDNYINCLFLSETLKKEGLVTTKAHSGEEAVDLCKNSDFDVVLMDISMKGIDGYEAMKQIKTKKPHIPVIIQTGYAILEEKDQAAENGNVTNGSLPVNNAKVTVTEKNLGTSYSAQTNDP